MSFLTVVIVPLAWLVDTLLALYTIVVIAAVVVSWLIAFGVVNMNNANARQIVRILDALTEPVFRPVRRIIPPIGGLDLSPLIVLIAIELLRIFFANLFAYILIHV
ncbi:MAG: YggT family protein [Rhizomicrobium sp.]